MTPTDRAAQRVTDEQARILADCPYEAIVAIGLAPSVNTSHLALDLLEARAEVERLKDAGVVRGTAIANLHDVITSRDAEIGALLMRLRGA